MMMKVKDFVCRHIDIEIKIVVCAPDDKNSPPLNEFEHVRVRVRVRIRNVREIACSHSPAH